MILPELTNFSRLFLDVETTGLDPWRDKICGIALAVDESDPIYIPIRHTRGKNEDTEVVKKWLQDIFDQTKEWVNHNIKFDMHFLKNDLGIDFDNISIFDTMTMSKLILTNLFKNAYSLEALATKLCGLPMDEKKEIKAYLKSIKSTNYADFPIDRMEIYAKMDIISTRKLWEYIVKNINPKTNLVFSNEKIFTRILYEIEQTGMRIDPQEVKVEMMKSLRKQINLSTLIKEKTGFEVNTKSTVDMQELMLVQLGLPILTYTDKGNPSFDKDTLSLYIVSNQISDANKEIIKLIRELNIEEHFYGNFLTPYNKLHCDGIIHPSYNQIVRTGRMSCSHPNAQQLNLRAKALIKPMKPGQIILSADASQIEFRIIAHYIEDNNIINAYKEDPNTDFHGWVSKMCGISRKNAKTINFTMAYGAGKAKVKEQLASNPEILALTNGDQTLCRAKAESIYNEYHNKIPGIKQITISACNTAKRRGNVFNLYGRIREIEYDHAFHAFNTVCQSTAADMMKDGVINLWKKRFPIDLFCLVHDDVLSYMDPDLDLVRDIKLALESISPPRPFSIPIRYDLGVSNVNWAMTSDKEDSQWPVKGKVVT